MQTGLPDNKKQAFSITIYGQQINSIVKYYLTKT